MFYRHDEIFQNSAAPGLLPNKMLTTAIVLSILTDIINSITHLVNSIIKEKSMEREK